MVEEGDGDVHPPGLPRCEEEARAGWRSVARAVHTLGGAELRCSGMLC